MQFDGESKSQLNRSAWAQANVRLIKCQQSNFRYFRLNGIFTNDATTAVTAIFMIIYLTFALMLYLSLCVIIQFANDLGKTIFPVDSTL